MSHKWQFSGKGNVCFQLGDSEIGTIKMAKIKASKPTFDKVHPVRRFIVHSLVTVTPQKSPSKSTYFAGEYPIGHCWSNFSLSFMKSVVRQIPILCLVKCHFSSCLAHFTPGHPPYFGRVGAHLCRDDAEHPIFGVKRRADISSCLEFVW